MDEEIKSTEALLGETANNVLSREMIRQACSVFRGPAVNRSKNQSVSLSDCTLPVVALKPMNKVLRKAEEAIAELFHLAGRL